MASDLTFSFGGVGFAVYSVRARPFTFGVGGVIVPLEGVRIDSLTGGVEGRAMLSNSNERERNEDRENVRGFFGLK